MAPADPESGRYLVTGGAGFIGCNFVHALLRRRPRARVTVLDKLTYAGNPANLDPVRDLPGFRFVRGDIAEESAVEPLLAEGFDYVINFAAETHVDRSIGDPSSFVRTDVFGVYTLLEAVRRHPVSRFVQISTDEVYGEILGAPASEEAPLLPRNPYSASKAEETAWPIRTGPPMSFPWSSRGARTTTVPINIPRS